MHATAWPEELDVEPGEVANFSVTVTNTSNTIDAYQVQVFGIDPRWVTATPPVLSLFPGDVDTMNVSIALPFDYPSSRRRLALDGSFGERPRGVRAHPHRDRCDPELDDRRLDRPADDAGRSDRAFRHRGRKHRQRHGHGNSGRARPRGPHRVRLLAAHDRCATRPEPGRAGHGQGRPRLARQPAGADLHARRSKPTCASSDRRRSSSAPGSAAG